MKIILDENDIKELIKQKYNDAVKITFNSKKGEISAIIDSNKPISVASPKPTISKPISGVMTGENRERKLVEIKWQNGSSNRLANYLCYVYIYYN